MPTCIYCLDCVPKVAFAKVEHVLPQSFGKFRDNLTLHEIVCDSCNALFGDELELYLARDTPDGLSRFLMGGKAPDEFKSLGKRSSMVHRADSGPLRGAFVVQRAVKGALKTVPLPQVGVGKVEGGPYEKWFLIDALPTREEFRALFAE
jgi:hypothetical protein